MYEIIRISDRPRLAETTGRWRWDAFFRKDGHALKDVLARETASAVSSNDLPVTVVLLEDDIPIGMASLAEHDLDDRHDLSPWLAGVFVIPDRRGQGNARRVVAAVETVALETSVPELWLYTSNAEGLYARIGWRTMERFYRDGKGYAIMRRDLSG